LPKGILTPSFIEIAPAVTKHALLTDDDDGRHVIAIAHQRRAKKFSLFFKHMSQQGYYFSHWLMKNALPNDWVPNFKEHQI
jgi:hypothetical protein